jgi:MoxR-like ATPase
MISGQVDNETTEQVIVAHYQGKTYSFNRTTNGGRGESNAWSKELGSKWNYDKLPLIGEVVATPLRTVDTDSLTNDEIPTVLIQKLTKAYRLRGTDVDESRTMSDVFQDVLATIESNPDNLSKYHSDGRSNKEKPQVKVTATKTMARPIAPVIKVVHSDNYTENSLSFVPSLADPEVSGYVNRSFDGVSDFDVLDHALINKLNVSLVGEAGTGKTSCAIAWAGHRGLRVYRVNFNAGIESSQLFGKLLPTEEGKLVWQDGGFTECWRNGNALIILDEMSFMPPKQSGTLFPSLDKRILPLLDNKGEVIPAGENVLVVGCWNDGYRGNNKPNQAFIDRFHHKLVFNYDIDIERKFIRSETLLTLAKQMREEAIAGVYETPISTRLLKNFQKFATELNYDYAVSNFVNNFTAEERPSVKLLLEAHRHNLESELSDVA